MILLTNERQAFHIPRAQAHEGLAGLKLEIDLIADKSMQLVDLGAVVSSHSDAGIDTAFGGRRFGACICVL